jgi:hypothetical protein
VSSNSYPTVSGGQASVDAVGWLRVPSNAAAPLSCPLLRDSRADWRSSQPDLEEMEMWIEPRYVRAGYS